MSTVKCNHMKRTTRGEGIYLLFTDTEVRKHGEQIRLGT
jgi:hypothetical protein